MLLPSLCMYNSCDESTWVWLFCFHQNWSHKRYTQQDKPPSTLCLCWIGYAVCTKHHKNGSTSPGWPSSRSCCVVSPDASRYVASIWILSLDWMFIPGHYTKATNGRGSWRLISGLSATLSQITKTPGSSVTTWWRRYWCSWLNNKIEPFDS